MRVQHPLGTGPPGRHQDVAAQHECRYQVAHAGKYGLLRHSTAVTSSKTEGVKSSTRCLTRMMRSLNSGLSSPCLLRVEALPGGEAHKPLRPS